MQMRQRRYQRRYGDLRRAVQNGLLDFLALFQVAIDVFDFDRGVVDQDADGQRQPAEGHDVDGFAERAQHDDGQRIDSGMEIAMINVLRQLPRNSRIMRPVRQAAITPSRITR